MNSKTLEPQESRNDASGTFIDQAASGSELDRRDFLRHMGKSLAVVASVPLLETMMGKAGAAFAAAPATQPRVSKSGLADVYAFKCGILKTQTQYMLKDTRVGTPMDIPVTFFMIRHGKDWVAFDTGNNAMVAKDPVGYWTAPIVKAYTPVMKDFEEFKIQIDKALGIRPKDLKAVILSHGHLDHAGAIDNFVGTGVPLYFQKKELQVIKDEMAKNKATGVTTAYIPGDFAKMNKLNIKTVDGVHDLFGDQSVVLFPTPGHTPGHQSLMVKQSNGAVTILCADAEYTLENMYEAIPPGLAWDIPQSSQALYMFKVMKWMGPNVEIVPSHDPKYWSNKPLAPKLYEL
ncbi:MAG TPA: N-acyl homoserine lactonase family protein [Spirochaetota bacterium]|nr:N-acyl homoserine lactonase family protein [Spirochaetota bacterium]